jgi:hypothetical protein
MAEDSSPEFDDDVTFYDHIEGYCGQLSYRPGETVRLHVSTEAATYHVAAHRWGAQRELVWSATGLPGAYVAPPNDADVRGCGWPVSVEIPIDRGWRSGFYLITLQAEDGPDGRRTAHACFVLRAHPDRRAAALLTLATNTWNAYNTWGGRSLYTGGTDVSFRRPFGRGMLSRPHVDRDDRKARPIRWGETPDVNGDHFQTYRLANGYPASIGSAGWFTHERRFVEWAEGRGYEFDYCISADLEETETLGDGATDGYDLLIDVGHDEYWSAPQRATVEAHVARGGSFASMSGNTMFWQVRLEGSTEDPTATMACHKYTAHETDPVVAAGRPEAMSGLWCDPLVGRPEWSLLGAGSAAGLYNRFGQAVAAGTGAFTVYRQDHWLLDGTGLRYGDLLGAKHGVVGYETVGCPIDLDEYQLPIARPGPDRPTNIEIVALTPSSNLGVGEYPASISALSDQGDLEFLAARLYGQVDDDSLARCRNGNAVLLVCCPDLGPGSGEVVVVGTTDWVYGLGDDEAVERVTGNILDRYLR